MDDNYYKHKVTDFRRFENRDDQLKGKDVTFSIAGLKNIIVDEKAQTHYINKDLPTFAFEVDFFRSSGKLTEGWLFDETKETQYYLLIWPFAKKEWDISTEDITRLRCMLISRKKIIDYLESEGFTKKRLTEMSIDIRANKKEGPIGRGTHPYIYLFSTNHLVERPINVVIRREKLKELAESSFDVSPPNVD